MATTDDWKQAFYTMLLWKVSDDEIDGRTTKHVPFIAGERVWATDSRMAIGIDLPACGMPSFNDKTQGPRRQLPIDAAFSRFDRNARDWSEISRIWLKIEHINLEDGDTVKRDFFDRYEIAPGIWVDSGRLYWFSLIPGVKWMVRDFSPKKKIVYFKFEDGIGCLSCLSPVAPEE